VGVLAAPIISAALRPAPRARTNRPGASSRTVLAADATTLTCRVTRFVTPVARVIRLVDVAASDSEANVSLHMSGESGTHTLSKPAVSA
jgi:hypothetical protein